VIALPPPKSALYVVRIGGLTLRLQVPPAPVSTVATAVNEPLSNLDANTATEAFACLLDTVPRSVTRRP